MEVIQTFSRSSFSRASSAARAWSTGSPSSADKTFSIRNNQRPTMSSGDGRLRSSSVLYSRSYQRHIYQCKSISIQLLCAVFLYTRKLVHPFRWHAFVYVYLSYIFICYFSVFQLNLMNLSTKLNNQLKPIKYQESNTTERFCDAVNSDLLSESVPCSSEGFLLYTELRCPLHRC